MEQLIDVNVTCDGTFLGDGDWIRAESCLRDSIIGNDVFINFRCQIINSVIGNNTQIASNVRIGEENEVTYIGDNCWVGADALILGNIHIGKNCVIGAYSIVTEDIPDNSIVYGREKLIVKIRPFTNDGPPDFKKALINNVVLKEQGKYLTLGNDKNYTSADITGIIHKIGEKNILIGNKITGGFIEIGDQVVIGDGNIFEGAGKIKIGSKTQIGNQTHIISNSHNYHFSSLPMTFEPVEIGSNVVVEDFSIILGGVFIPDNSVIKAGSFIRK